MVARPIPDGMGAISLEGATLTTQDVVRHRARALAFTALTFVLGGAASAQAATLDPPLSYPVGGVRPVAVAVGDLNGDTVNDLAVANNNSANISVLYGKTGGGYDAPVTFPVGSGPSGIAIGDLNGDSRPDLAVSNRLTANVSILLAKAGGGFDPATSFAAGNQPLAVVIGDLNGDGKKDVMTGNQVSDDLSLLIGDGAGGFAPTTSVPAGDGPDSIALGDLDEDGDQDVAVALLSGDMMSILKGNGSGGFGAPELYTAANGPQSVAIGNLKEDSRPDVAVANVFSDLASVYLNQGGGVFSRQALFTTGDAPRSLAIGDLNGDKHEDLAIADGDADTVSVLAGDGTGGFGTREVFPAGDSPSSIAIAQLNGAGLADVVVADRFGEVVSVLVNTGTPPTPPDTTAPVITTPDPMVVDATSTAGAEVKYAVTVTDDRDTEPSLSCAPASGWTFPVGTSTVKCDAEDDAGNDSTATFSVTVVPVDKTAPLINTPAAITVNATAKTGAIVTYAVSASDDRDANPTLTCAPASGTWFAIGTTTVDCTARDSAGNTTVNSFTVRVKGAAEQIVDLIDKMRTMAGLGPVAPALRTQLQSIATCVITKNTKMACIGVDLFIALARYANTRGYITTAQVNSLIADVTRIRAVIGCP